MEQKKIIAVAVVVVVAIAAIAGAVVLLNNNSNGVKAWSEGDKITIATSPDFAPYDDLSGEKYLGIDMDIIRIVMWNMGLKEGEHYEFQTVQFDAIVLGVTQGKYTIGASGFTQTADRMGNVLFTEEYAMTNQCLVALKSNNSITTENLSQKTIAVQSGTTGDNIARQFYAKDDGESNIRSLPTYSDTILQVQSGAADCIIVDHETALGMVAKTAGTGSDKELEIKNAVKIEGVNEYYSFIMNKVNTELCMKISTILRDYKTVAPANVIDDIISYYAMNDNVSGTPSFWDSHSLDAYKL